MKVRKNVIGSRIPISKYAKRRDEKKIKCDVRWTFVQKKHQLPFDILLKTAAVRFEAITVPYRTRKASRKRTGTERLELGRLLKA
jgi:hypothetical protein